MEEETTATRVRVVEGDTISQANKHTASLIEGAIHECITQLRVALTIDPLFTLTMDMPDSALKHVQPEGLADMHEQVKMAADTLNTLVMHIGNARASWGLNENIANMKATYPDAEIIG